MSIKKFQMKDLLEQVALNEAKKKKAEEDDDEEDMDEEVVLEKAEEELDEEELDESDSAGATSIIKKHGFTSTGETLKHRGVSYKVHSGIDGDRDAMHKDLVKSGYKHRRTPNGYDNYHHPETGHKVAYHSGEGHVLIKEGFDYSEEDFGALDEISKELAGRYVVKAAGDMHKQDAKRSEQQAKKHKAGDSMRRVKAAGPDKDYGETDSEHGERVARLAKRRAEAEKGEHAADKKVRNRHQGIFNAGKRLAKEEYMDEETLAASTLRGGSRPEGEDPKSKVEYLRAIIGHLASAEKEDLVKWFDQTQALYHAGKDWGVGDKSASNQSSIDMHGGSGPKTKDAMPKLGVKEDVEEMFAGQDLSEEFKENAAALFEAAIHARAMVEVARLEEEFEEKLVEAVADIQEELTSKVDSYLEYVVESWMEENAVAVESTLRNELMEEFIGGLQGLFAEHYIDVPEDKVNVLEALAAKVEALEDRLDDTINENTELKAVVAEVERNEIFESLCEGLAFSQVEKFRALAEGIDFDGDVETYGRKLSFVKENYFKTKSSVYASNIEEETFEGEESTSTVSIDPTVNRYVQAISKTIKK